MMLDRTALLDRQYILLLLVLNLSKSDDSIIEIEKILRAMKPLAGNREVLHDLEASLAEFSLVNLFTKERKKTYEVKRDGYAGLSWLGLAYLINHADYYITRIREHYSDLPEKLITSVVRYIDLSTVPAADRFLNVGDAKDEFGDLNDALQKIADEITRDANKNELPIKNKNAVLADIHSVQAQIKDGTVRLSDLVTKLRPALKNIAEVCKDIAVIAGAAAAAYAAITHILVRLF
jgi:hypothetical protein